MIITKNAGYDASGRRRLFKGGGGSSANYASLEDLYKEQAASAKMLREQVETYLPGAVQSYVKETNQVLDDGYVDKQAASAATDLANAGAQERAAASRSLASMGVNPSDPRFAGSMRSTELSNAARTAAGKNAARTAAENYQLNVAKDAVGTFTGQSNQAASQMGNAASGLGSIYTSQANMAANQSAQQASAVGSLVGAGIAGYGIYNSKKDGGRIVMPAGLRRRVEQRAMGGGVGGGPQGFFQMQAITPPPSVQAQPRADAVGSALGTANMVNGLYKAGTGAGKAAATKTAETAGGKAAESAASAAGSQATTDAASSAASAATADAAATATTDAAATAATDAAATGAATAAAGEAAAGGAAAAIGAASAALPWVGAAYAAGKLLDFWANGGEVGTQNPGMTEQEAENRFAAAEKSGDVRDIRAGGKVPGEWEGNTDNVPALLTEGEHVINAEAAALVGAKHLDELNKKGLALRAKGYTPGQIMSGARGLKRRAV